MPRSRQGDKEPRFAVQVVDEIYDEFVAKKMGIDQKGQVCAARLISGKGIEP